MSDIFEKYGKWTFKLSQIHGEEYFTLEELYQAIECRIMDKLGIMIKNAEEKVNRESEDLIKQVFKKLND